MADMEEKRRIGKMGNRRRMTNSSFSSISFEAETAKRFKKLSTKLERNYSQTLDHMMKSIHPHLFKDEKNDL